MFMVVLKLRPVKTIINVAFQCSFFFFIFCDITSGDQKTQCGHPAVPINCQAILASEEFVVGSTVMYKCDDGYELFGSSIAICSENGTWSEELPFCGINVAVRKPANQSSTIRGGSAINANDGDKTTVHDGKRCTETMKELSPWWQVDLLKPYPIKIIRITTRGCCGHQKIQDLEIRVGNSSSELQRNPLCAWFPGTIDEGVTKSFTCARMLIGQYVFLQLVSTEGSLSLCEVEVFTTEEFSNDHCASSGVSNEIEYTSFNRMCYDFHIDKGSSFNEARWKCQKTTNGDLIHNFKGITNAFIIAELERRKEKLKTQLVWIGAQKEPGLTSKIWKWINGDVIGKPSWGRDQPNNYNGEQNCVVLDGGRNWLWNDVGCNLDYLYAICQHKPAFCGSANKKINTTIIGENKHIGAVIHYRCPDGYALIGNKNRTCTENGLWSGEAPSCSYVNCGDLPGIGNGSVTFINNSTAYGAKVVYKCNINYTLVGTDTRFCNEDGSWSDKEPLCFYDWCPDPPEILGGIVSVNGKRVGSKAVYTCFSGYVLSGHHELLCDVGGKWFGKRPACRYIDCGLPSVIENGQYKMINGTSIFGSIIEFTCNKDYWIEPQNHSRLICTREGIWFPEAPTCELITCEEPDVPPGGYVVGYDFNIHSKIKFYCEAGYLLIGEDILQCIETGEWNGTSPNCQYINCGKLPSLLYGFVNYINNSTHLNSEVTYNCTHSYKLIGSSARKCLETGSWSGISPKCEEIRCPEPILPPHSIISVTGNDRVYGRTLIRTSNDAFSVTTYKIGALVKYRCERGYKILGMASGICEENGQWSGDIPNCIYVDCGMPEIVEHGSFTLASNVTYYGSAVLYECDSFYELDGHSRRLCLENGSWSSETPKCKEIICEEPPVNESMIVKVSKYTVGGIAYYSCEKGFFLNGDNTRECQKDGTWTGKIPLCKSITCEYPKSIENGRVIVINQSLNYNSIIEYHCIPRYERIGPFLRKCMDDRKWSGNEPKCEMRMSFESNNDPSNTSLISIGIGTLCLLLIFGIIYLKLRKGKPSKNTRSMEERNKKEESSGTVINENVNNIYEHISRNEDSIYDTPYESFNHYESSPVSTRDFNVATVTINGVALR